MWDTGKGTYLVVGDCGNGETYDTTASKSQNRIEPSESYDGKAYGMIAS